MLEELFSDGENVKVEGSDWNWTVTADDGNTVYLRSGDIGISFRRNGSRFRCEDGVELVGITRTIEANNVRH